MSNYAIAACMTTPCYYALSNNYTSTGSYSATPVSGAISGILEGLGNTISGLSISTTTYGQSVAFLAHVTSTSAVNDLYFTGLSVTATEDPSVTAGSSVGGLVVLNEGTLSNDVVDATSSVSTPCSGCDATGISVNIGGLAGTNQGTITNSSSAATVSNAATASNVGGLVGSNLGQASEPATISYSSASGNVTGSVQGSDHDGGLVGFNGGGTIQNSYASGGTIACSYTDTAGGLVGASSFNPTDSSVLGYILASYATDLVGSTTGCSTPGGLVGTNGTGGIIGPASGGTPVTSYALGNVVSPSSAGGLVGTNSPGGVIEYAFARGSVNAAVIAGGLVASNQGTVTQSFYWPAGTNSVGDNGGAGGSRGFGGLVGWNEGTGEIDNSYSLGNVETSSDSDGGFVGENDIPTSGGHNISNVYEAGSVVVTGSGFSCIGGFAAKNDFNTPTASVQEALWDTEVARFV